jgi:hypothetical protein
MKYNKVLFLFLFVSIFHNVLNAQSLLPEVIASNGDFYTSTAGSISFTIGETVVETFSSSSRILTQGFQQPFLSVTEIASNENFNSILAYPNPAGNKISFDFIKMENGIYDIFIYDVSGKQVYFDKTMIGSGFYTRDLSLSGLENGIYLVRISNEQNCNKTFRIVKQN